MILGTFARSYRAILPVLWRDPYQQLVHVVPDEHDAMEVMLVGLHLALDFAGRVYEASEDYDVAARQAVGLPPLVEIVEQNPDAFLEFQVC